MSISVRCNCGQAFNARDDLAGVTVKCPKCRGRLTIPKPPPPPTIRACCSCGKSFLAQEQLAGRTVKCPSCGGPLSVPDPAAAASPSMADLLDEVDAEKQANQQLEEARMAELRKITCIECGAQVHPNSSMCRSCGYCPELGRKIQPQAETKWERSGRDSNLADAAQDLWFGGHETPEASFFSPYESVEERRFYEALEQRAHARAEQKAMDNWLRYI